MRLDRTAIVIILSAALLGCATKTGSEGAVSNASQGTLTVQQARADARDAYIFAYPLVLNYRTMYMQAIKGNGAFGKWLHLGPSSPADTDIVTPNNDSPYSYAWVDLRAEPWVLTLPKIEKNRYYTSQWDDLWGFVVDNPGSLNDGNNGSTVLLAAPDWSGAVPPGVKRVVRGESSILGTLTRTQMLGAGDLARVQQIQRQYKLQPLSAYLGTPAPAAAPAVQWPAWQEGDEKTEKFWSYAGLMLQFTTQNSADAAAYGKLAALGVKAGSPWQPEKLDPAIREAIKAGVADAQAEFVRAGNDPKLDSGKLFGNRERMGTDYLDRTLGVVLGIFGNVKEQAMYLQMPLDANGQPLDGSKHSYTLTFDKAHIPPVKYFWSITMYKLPQRWLVQNPINRYSIGSSTKGLKYGKDGSLRIYVSAKSPGKDKESNWLPAPDGPFWTIMRNYGPGQTIIDGNYQRPEYQPVAQ